MHVQPLANASGANFLLDSELCVFPLFSPIFTLFLDYLIFYFVLFYCVLLLHYSSALLHYVSSCDKSSNLFGPTDALSDLLSLLLARGLF